MSRTVPVFFVALIAFFMGYAFAQPSAAPEKSVEIVAAGKMYPSLHEYKLQQFKDNLRGVLSSRQLREFSEEEIAAVIRELKTQPPVMAQFPAPKPADERIKLIEKALQDYNAGYRDDASLATDPAQGKTIIIKPSAQDRSSDVQTTDVR